MATHVTKLPLIDPIEAKRKENQGSAGRDNFCLGTLPDMIERLSAMTGAARQEAIERGRTSWAGGIRFDDALRTMETGDLSLVAKSDALLDRYEGLAPATRKMKTIGAVAGGCPNVGAYLAGSPVAMRRRQRMMDDCGPLAVIVDVASSGGITHDQLARRGAAVLALVRLLGASRPVTLWIGCSVAAQGNRYNAAHMFASIDTAPLDLARTAFLLQSPTYARTMLYSLAMEVTETSGTNVIWPYDGHATLIRTHAHAILSRVIDAESALYVGPAFLHDANIQNPEIWLLDMLKQYGGNPDAEAA